MPPREIADQFGDSQRTTYVHEKMREIFASTNDKINSNRSLYVSQKQMMYGTCTCTVAVAASDRLEFDLFPWNYR